MDFRFIIMIDGVASVQRERGAIVHGLLWSLPFSDIPPLDAFEEVAEGLYTKTVQPVLKSGGSMQALLYLGHTQVTGLPLPGYLEAVVAGAKASGLPDAYCRSLSAWGARGTRGAAFQNIPPEDPARPVPGVRPRHRTPFDIR